MSQSVDDLASLPTPLERGESLPARWYTDPAITEREIHQIFRKTWSYVGPANELTNLGDYLTGYVGEIPVVVVRNEGGTDRSGECLPPPAPRGHEGPRQREGHAVSAITPGPTI